MMDMYCSAWCTVFGNSPVTTHTARYHHGSTETDLFAALVALTFIPVLAHAAVLTVSVDGSGSIGDGSSTCTDGCTWNYPDGIDVVLSITPDTGNHVADVLVDGSSVGAVPSYTFTGITSNLPSAHPLPRTPTPSPQLPAPGAS